MLAVSGIRKAAAWVTAAGLAGVIAGMVARQQAVLGPSVIVLFCAMAVALMASESGRRYAFTVWVFAFVAAALFYPAVFGKWFGRDLKILIVPLIQIIMFGMGTTLSLADFRRILAMPTPVFIGVFLQYAIMPFVGFSLARTFGFEPEIAAGLVLIGSAPGGVASNVINYLARCNVPLSVTMTAVSTLVSPIMTPLMMKLLAGQYIEVKFVTMMLDTFNMIVVPIAAGLIANRVLYSPNPAMRRAGPLAAIGLIAVLATIAIGLSTVAFGGLRSGLMVGCLLVGVVAAAKLVMDVGLRYEGNWMDHALPVLSMTAICLIIAIITASSSEKLRTVGATLLCAVMLHNLLGYCLAYYAARGLRLNVIDARTVAVEVGMQNGGMASALAMNTLHSVNAALAPAIFGPWQNISGSILATWWRRRPVETTEAPLEPRTEALPIGGGKEA
jgi:BASS family bile acid:Na+ symporter